MNRFMRMIIKLSKLILDILHTFKRLVYLAFLIIIFIIILYVENILPMIRSYYLVLILVFIIANAALIFEKYRYHKIESNLDFLTHRIITFTLMTILISPFAVYFASLYFKLNSGFLVKVGSVSDWIQFSGSLIGGSLTLFAVIFAFSLEKESRALELDRTQTPKLQLESTLTINELTGSREKSFIYYDSDSNYVTTNLSLKLSNISSYPAKSFDVISCCFEIYNQLDLIFPETAVPEYSQDFQQNFIKQMAETRILFGEYSMGISLPLHISKYYLNNNSNEPVCFLKTVIQYTSQFEQITYQLNSRIEIHFLSKNEIVTIENRIFPKYFLKISEQVNSLSIVD